MDDRAPRPWRHSARSSPTREVLGPLGTGVATPGALRLRKGEARPEIPQPETRPESLGHPGLSGRLSMEQQRRGRHLVLPSEKTPEAVHPLHAGGHDVGRARLQTAAGAPPGLRTPRPLPAPPSTLCPSVPSCLLLPRTHHPKGAQRPQAQQQEGVSSHGGRGNSRVTGSVTCGSPDQCWVRRAVQGDGAGPGDRAGPGRVGCAWAGSGGAGPGEGGAWTDPALTKCSGGTETCSVQVLPGQAGAASLQPARLCRPGGRGPLEDSARTGVRHSRGPSRVPAAMPGGWDDHGPKGQLEAWASPAWSACIRKPSSAGTVCKGFG